ARVRRRLGQARVPVRIHLGCCAQRQLRPLRARASGNGVLVESSRKKSDTRARLGQSRAAYCAGHEMKPVIGSAATRFLTIAGFLLLPGALHAQNYPEKTVVIVAPFPAGGSVDLVARAVAQQMSESWKQPVIVSNRP